ncbi:MAG: M48 family metallopeptidase [Planctomycetes bacterium]|nr:M48 family metallopeptidase [Planctomycetota bacterium]
MTAVASDRLSFKARVDAWAAKIDVEFEAITVREMRRKWASCSTAGRLTFDSTCLELRPRLQDYVIVHELLHLRVPNHGKLWKSLLSAYLGNYAALEAELRRVAAKQLST